MAASVAIERMERFVKSRRRQLITSETFELSDREKLVLRLIAEGLTADEIAGQLHIGSGSVCTYVRRMLEKLGARNSTHAVSIAWQIGLFDD
jgi:DNA-binding NarL/FixJ family response regulator